MVHVSPQSVWDQVAYTRLRLAYDILWVAVPTTLCCGWRTLCQLCLVGGGPCTFFWILYTGYSKMYPYGIHVSPKLCRSLWRPCVMYIVCVAMASMCHLKCAGSSGVYVSPKICGSLWCPCVTWKCVGRYGIHVLPKMRGSLWRPCVTKNLWLPIIVWRPCVIR